MFHETLTPLALIVFMAVARPLSAADRLVDGVPLPGDAKVATVVETDPAELRQWAGVWVGAWDGALVLLVESVTADGLARVVYAFGDNPWLGIRRGWSRHEATLSGRRLTISEAGFSATYDLNDQGGLNATYLSPFSLSHFRGPLHPASWGNTGNFDDSDLGGASEAAKKGTKSVSYGPIPYAS